MPRNREQPLLPPRHCKQCQAEFTPRQRLVKGTYHVPEHCSNRCARKTVYANNVGKPPLAAIAARSIAQRKRRAAQLRDRFGYLSDREIDLVAHAQAYGYDCGFNAAIKAYKPKETT